MPLTTMWENGTYMHKLSQIIEDYNVVHYLH